MLHFFLFHRILLRMHHTASQHSIVKKSIPIVYEDKTLCIVNKPYGIPVQGGANIAVCLIDLLSAQLGIKIYPVHRLDKETSGLLITAKTPEAAGTCRALFESNAVEKEYTALCFGGFKRTADAALHTAEEAATAHTTPRAIPTVKHELPAAGTINIPIIENGRAKPALSTYRLLTGTEAYSLFSVRIHSGRMHQIRIHLAGIGYPIIGDDKHGNFALNKQLWKTQRIKKLQLCATSLSLPIEGKKRLFTVPLPEHIQTAVDVLIPQNTAEEGTKV